MGVFENVVVLGHSGADLETELLHLETELLHPETSPPGTEPEAATSDLGASGATQPVDKDSHDR